MTDLADGVVYSRSGLTYQAGLLETAGLVTRATVAGRRARRRREITEPGRELLATVFPGHVEVLNDLLFQRLQGEDVRALTHLLTPVRDHIRSTPPRSAAPRRRKGNSGGS